MRINTRIARPAGAPLPPPPPPLCPSHATTLRCLPQGRVYALPDVWIRPAFGGKGRKVTGTLEAHANGFRYTSPKGEELDIMYRCGQAWGARCMAGGATRALGEGSGAERVVPASLHASLLRA